MKHGAQECSLKTSPLHSKHKKNNMRTMDLDMYYGNAGERMSCGGGDASSTLESHCTKWRKQPSSDTFAQHQHGFAL